MYYSGWYQSFPAGFARTVASEGAVPLVQMDPENISVAAIASGHYDGYLTSYAEAVRHYHYPVIVSFGHEMNGGWYSWGYRKTSAATFVAAWRHIVSLFRAAGARNVTWLWTVNIIDDPHYGWGRWARGGVETCTIPGNHMEMFHDKNINLVARKVAARQPTQPVT